MVLDNDKRLITQVNYIYQKPWYTKHFFNIKKGSENVHVTSKHFTFLIENLNKNWSKNMKTNLNINVIK